MKKVKYDYVVVGAGLTGCICARELTDKGYKCLVIDKNDYVGGLCSTKEVNNVVINRFGVHIFHTDNHRVYGYVGRYSWVKPYKYRVVARYFEKFFPFPVNLMTLNILFGIKTPNKARQFIHTHKKVLLDVFFRDYSEKQWGVPLEDIPKSIIDRILFRSDFSTDYFKNSTYEGMVDSKAFFGNLLNGIDFKLLTDFEKGMYEGCKIIYTGRIDEYYNFQYGELKYRCVKYKVEELNEIRQGTYVVNHVSNDVSYTRTIEYRYVTEGGGDAVIFQTEYPSSDGVPAYPFPDDENINLYNKYLMLSLNDESIDFVGRLATYTYLNMDEAILKALEFCDGISNKQG